MRFSPPNTSHLPFALKDTDGIRRSLGFILRSSLREATCQSLKAAGFSKSRPDFRLAVATQDELPYTEPPFWYYPTRHTLGKALLAADDAAGAEEVYRRDLETYPRNDWALYGLVRSLEAQGKEASEVQERFDKIWAQADVTLTASRF